MSTVNCAAQVFRQDFTLCLLLGSFMTDPILEHSQQMQVHTDIKPPKILSNSDISQVAIYGAGAAFRSRSVSGLKLMLAEGHVLGQVIILAIRNLNAYVDF